MKPWIFSFDFLIFIIILYETIIFAKLDKSRIILILLVEIELKVEEEN